jgi:hypothetical protein
MNDGLRGIVHGQFSIECLPGPLIPQAAEKGAQPIRIVRDFLAAEANDAQLGAIRESGIDGLDDGEECRRHTTACEAASRSERNGTGAAVDMRIVVENQRSH